VDRLGVVCSVIVGVAFVVAGASKLAAGPQWPAEARGLRAPAAAIPVVPWFEIALGAVLIVHLAPVAAALVALATLVAFTALILARLAAGEHPPCACFGRWSAAPLGRGHVVRNAALSMLALIAALAAS
jgi:uncharacterized membrane protein YphA (DoxX/SURF4 family)